MTHPPDQVWETEREREIQRCDYMWNDWTLMLWDVVKRDVSMTLVCDAGSWRRYSSSVGDSHGSCRLSKPRPHQHVLLGQDTEVEFQAQEISYQTAPWGICEFCLLHLTFICSNAHTHAVSVTKSPLSFPNIFPKWLGILYQFLHTYYTFLSMLEYKFFFYSVISTCDKVMPY